LALVAQALRVQQIHLVDQVAIPFFLALHLLAAVVAVVAI
jgi:hypothetical protein